MTLSIATARMRVYNVLNGVAVLSGARVYDYFRYSNDEGTMRSFFVGSSGRLNAWMVSLSPDDPYITLNAQGGPGHSGINFEQARFTFHLHGYYAHDDAGASEKAWADQVEAVIAAFRAAVLTGSPKLGDANVIDAGPAQWVEGPLSQFCGVLCHRGRLTMPLRVQTYP
jgi:hypothetical protein